jgi:hypothetical protein
MATAIKGKGKDSSHHGDEDQGSFVFYKDGEILLFSPGYYEGEAEKHNLPTIGNEAEMKMDVRAYCPLGEVGEIGEFRTMDVDSTAAYNTGPNAAKPLAERVVRHFVQIGAKALIVLDDVTPKDPNAAITAHYQAAVPVSISGGTAQLQGKKGNVTLHTFGPTLQLESKDRVYKTKDWNIGLKTGLPWTTVRGAYTMIPDKPLVNVLVPEKDGDAMKPNVVYNGDSIRVSVPGAEEVRFKKSQDGWVLERPDIGNK